VQPKLREFICVNLCLSACICGKKKIISRIWDDKALTLIHAEVEKRDRNNSDANRLDIKPLVAYPVSYQIRLKYPVYFLVSLDSDFDRVGAVLSSLIKGFLKRIWINTHQIKHDILISVVLMSTNGNFDDKFSALTGFREALQFAVVFFNNNLVRN